MSNNLPGNQSIPKVKNQFDEVFEVEIDGWCYGLTNFPGEIHSALVHRVIKELGAAFREAVENNYIFNVLDLATRLSRAGKYFVSEKEVAFAIIYNLPHPVDFDDDGQFVLAQIVNQVEQAYGGAIDKIRKKWKMTPPPSKRAA